MPKSTVRPTPAPHARRYDAVVSTSPTPPPGERRLERPPSDRYRDAEAEAAATAAATTRPPSAARAIVAALVAGLVGALVTVVLGGLLGLSAGLVVVAGATGWAIGTALRTLAGATLPRPRRVGLALAITLVGFALGQIGLWWYAGTEGGVLSLADYLGETFGPLVPVQAALGIAFAWWAAR